VQQARLKRGLQRRLLWRPAVDACADVIEVTVSRYVPAEVVGQASSQNQPMRRHHPHCQASGGTAHPSASSIGRVAPARCHAGAPSEPGERAFPAPRLRQAARALRVRAPASL
jgi:hypothetical protein